MVKSPARLGVTRKSCATLEVTLPLIIWIEVCCPIGSISRPSTRGIVDGAGPEPFTVTVSSADSPSAIDWGSSCALICDCTANAGATSALRQRPVTSKFFIQLPILENFLVVRLLRRAAVLRDGGHFVFVVLERVEELFRFLFR